MQNYTCIMILHAEAWRKLELELEIDESCALLIHNVRTAELCMNTACGRAAQRNGQQPKIPRCWPSPTPGRSRCWPNWANISLRLDHDLCGSHACCGFV
jgi:hypothetical protein